MAAGSVVVGDRLGLYRALAGKPQTAAGAGRRDRHRPRYVEEWLRGQAAGGYVGYDAAGGTYSLTEEQAFALTDPDGPVYMPGAFELALGSLQAVPRITEAVRTGSGRRLARARRRRVHRLRAVLPARLPREPDAVVAAGAGRRRGEAAGGRDRVADIGCGHGASTVLMADAYPGVDLRRLRLPRRVDRAGAEAGRARPASATGSPSRSPRRRPSPAGRTTWSRRSTRCTTWATRWARPATSARRWRRTAPG